MKFRNQFFISNQDLPADYGLSLTVLGNLNIYTHPILNISSAVSESSEILLLGYILNPLAPSLTSQAIIESIVVKAKTKDAFFHAIQTLSGRFVLLYKNNSDFLITGDAWNSRYIFYSFDNDRVILTSSQRMYVDLYGKIAQISEEKQELMRMSKFHELEWSWYGDEGFDDRLKRILPNHYLDLTSRRIYRIPIFRDSLIDSDDLIEYAATVIKGSISAMTRRYHVVQPLTAGLDSRMLLAASRDNLDSIDYFVFNHKDSVQNNHDVLVPDRLSYKLGFCLRTIRPARLRADFLQVYHNEHIAARVSYQTTEIQYHYDRHIDSKVVRISGLGGEVGRLRMGYTDRPIKADLLCYLSGYGKASAFVTRMIAAWLAEATEYACEYSIPVLDLFYWEQYLFGKQVLYPFEQDIAIEEFWPFANRNMILSILRSDCKERVYHKCGLYMRIIDKMWPDVLSEPINPKSFKDSLKGILSSNLMLRYLKKRFMQ